MDEINLVVTFIQWKRISNGRPFVLKGIQCVEDALKAYEAGCEGIVVTNHAGRQVDGAVGSLEVLPEIVEAVGDSVFPPLSVSMLFCSLIILLHA
jgi:isopentenyl diphosphate isomerase/L-lactate dehydrogenase-like FMN-dependent dehydrogenase